MHIRLYTHTITYTYIYYIHILFHTHPLIYTYYHIHIRLYTHTITYTSAYITHTTNTARLHTTPDTEAAAHDPPGEVVQMV